MHPDEGQEGQLISHRNIKVFESAQYKNCAGRTAPMTTDKRKIEQMKLFRLWASKKISAEVYAEETLKLMERWAIENYGKRAS